MIRYLFVGERQSRTAAERHWTWVTGRLCAGTLMDALDAAGFAEPYDCINLWSEPGVGQPSGAPALAPVSAAAEAGTRVVALGRRVARVLERAGIPHIALVHPAARGAIRLRANYRAHVRAVLCPEEAR